MKHVVVVALLFAFCLAAAPGVVFGATDQEGFAFGDDDGSESAHTLDTPDADITSPLGTKTLRALIDATGDPAPIAYKLKFQKNGAGGYGDVPVGAQTVNTVALDGTDSINDGSNATSASLGLDLPAYSSGDLVVVALDLWSNGAAKTVTWPSGPDGETFVDVVNAYGSGTSNTTYLAIGYYIATAGYAGATDAVTVTASATTRWAGAVTIVPSGEYDATTPISSQTGSDLSTTDDTTPNYTGFSAASDDGGGKLLALVGVDQDAITGTPTGWTALETLDQGRAVIQLAGRDAAVSNSESIAASAGWTISNDAWAVYAFIVRPSVTTNEVYVDTSGNVTAGGESTTARLSAPSGKNTGDFDTGRRWDDENGSDSINITNNNYTELEWVLTVDPPGTDDDYYEFRVYDGDSVLDTYSVTPRWTIGVGGGGEGGDITGRTMRLFAGFFFKLFSGKLILY